MLDIDEDARNLAEIILAGGGMPEEYPEDALHIAVAVANGIDVPVLSVSLSVRSPAMVPSART